MYKFFSSCWLNPLTIITYVIGKRIRLLINEQKGDWSIRCQIYSLMFVEDSKTVVLVKKSHQHDAEGEKEQTFKDFQKVSCFVNSFIRTWAIGSDLCYLKMRYTHYLIIWGKIYNEKPYDHEFEEVLSQLFSKFSCFLHSHW
jgi:hypothetical protein